jgi:predicted RNase H-like HicB family nuclease
MTTEIVFLVEEAPEGGYTARALTQAIFTEGETPEELESNARDAVRCHFDEKDLPKVIRLHYVRDDVIAV